MKKQIYIFCLATMGIFSACKEQTEQSGNAEKNTPYIEEDIFIKESNQSDEVEIITFSGEVQSYDTNTGYGCFFVYQEMVELEITQGLGSKAESGVCTDTKLGKGVPVNFSGLDSESNYPNVPVENVLIEVKGYWKIEFYQNKNNVNVFYVIEYEPFF